MCEMSKGLISWKHTTEPEETEERRRHSSRGVGKDKKWKWKRARRKSVREGKKEGCVVLCTLMTGIGALAATRGRGLLWPVFWPCLTFPLWPNKSDALWQRQHYFVFRLLTLGVYMAAPWSGSSGLEVKLGLILVRPRMGDRVVQVEVVEDGQ